MEGMLNRHFLAFRNHKLITLQLILLIGISILLRLASLGYSNFQGDEIRALCRYSNFATPLQFITYLLGQRKGPLQFVITCGISLLDPRFSSEFTLRLPFAIANLMAVACLFLLVYHLFTLEIAIYSSFLFAVDGIFIAFARIVQYQSFTLLGGIAGLLCLILSLKYDKWRVPGLYLGFISVALSLLAHFDAAFFLPPMAVLVLHWWLSFRKEPDFTHLRMHLIAALALFTLLLAGFYLPYAMHLGSYQVNYWESRFNGSSTNFLQLFKFYNPGPVVWIGLAWILLGLTRIRNSLGWQLLLAWLLPPLIFMTIIFKDSLTHAYTYLLPLLIVAGIGVDVMVGWIRSLFRGRSLQFAQAVILVVFLIFSYLSYEVYIDHNPEYPWNPKRVLGMELEGQSSSNDALSAFGFPYSRQWRDIGRWFENLQTDNDVVLVTNERSEIAEFYLPSKVSDRPKYNLREFSDDIRAPHGLYILVVESPQSSRYRLWGLDLDKWREKFVPLHDFMNEDGERVASVYFLTQEQIEAAFHG
jgi:4-amino-4-deoxy-L-arabinose transferase-like glycosyltransferase